MFFMKPNEMGVLNDNGLPLNLSVVFIFFMIPNLIFIILTCLNIYLVQLSKNHPRLDHLLGEIANFFAKGALDRIVKNMLQHFEEKKRQQEEQIPMTERRLSNLQKFTFTSKTFRTSANSCSFEKKYDANYLLLVPFQIELLLTVFVYKILTRDVYPETCQTFLTTYVNRENQVVCWLKHINGNLSNLSFNITLPQYCTNQTITYMNFEHNDVICVQYVFKLINIIDTVTNIFAWHQASVFIVTKSIFVSYWYQQKLRRTFGWFNLFDYHHRIILSIVICFSLAIYILLFLFILPLHFAFKERIRIDLTRHLLYACSKFFTAILIHVNLYTLYQWYSHTQDKDHLLTSNEEKDLESPKAVEAMIAFGTSEYISHPNSMMAEDYLGTTPMNYLTPNVSV